MSRVPEDPQLLPPGPGLQGAGPGLHSSQIGELLQLKIKKSKLNKNNQKLSEAKLTTTADHEISRETTADHGSPPETTGDYGRTGVHGRQKASKRQAKGIRNARQRQATEGNRRQREATELTEATLYTMFLVPCFFPRQCA